MAGPASGPNSAQSQLDALYQVWAGRLPVTVDSAGPVVARPSAHGTQAGEPRPTWEEQAIADALLPVEPRNGLRLLRGAQWRSSLPDLVDYLKGRRSSLEPLLGAGAVPFLAVLVRAAVASSDLTPDVAEHLLARAGLAAKRTN